MRSIPKNGPKLNKQALWRVPSSNGFYVWGGTKAYFDRASPNELWRFEVDGNGGGTWSQVIPASVVAFKSLVRTTDGSFAQSKDVGYYFGGAATTRSDASINDKAFAIPGLISYNMTSGEIRNTSSTGFGQYGTLVRGSAQFVPFGSGGMLLFLGGSQSRVFLSDWAEMDFNKITLYHPSTDRWYTQQTTGSRPTGRGNFCVVGASSTNYTYDIFLYGGISSKTDSTKTDGVYGDVYVLSLPGFVFFKAADSSVPRADHACVVVAEGGRQMLSIGGVDGSQGFPKLLTDPDPWELGLGIFDMTEMRWSDRYDSQAQPYESPDVVKQWYAQGGLDSVVWANEELKALFPEPPDNSTSGPSTTGQPNARDQPSKPTIGTIIGATIGGIAGLVLVTCLAVFFLKRKKRHQAAPQQEAGGAPPGYEEPRSKQFVSEEPVGINALHEGRTYHFNLVELPAEQGAAELSSANGRYEFGQTVARPPFSG
ncbi:kelch repeat protein [Colletotrichum paranaense]|uniref:Kelch repeat protein n=2 Tax=Colletotrichum acutatum species complex TaxID=2707335 RepID=A0AAI9XN31_9PEZI|nr:kelch repeat protein [Colletotrichum paranaense]KAK1454020.1 kelch repeat protein [Colletotrichum melonis]KAK1538484.1 kelch repeat protein [Colletotrichum paranaense]